MQTERGSLRPKRPTRAGGCLLEIADAKRVRVLDTATAHQGMRVPARTADANTMGKFETTLRPTRAGGARQQRVEVGTEKRVRVYMRGTRPFPSKGFTAWHASPVCERGQMRKVKQESACESGTAIKPRRKQLDHADNVQVSETNGAKQGMWVMCVKVENNALIVKPSVEV